MSVVESEPVKAHGMRTRGLKRIGGQWLLIAIVLGAFVLLIALAGTLGFDINMRTMLLLLPVSAALVLLSRATSRHVPYHKTNRKLEERIENLVELLCRVDRSLVIVTGSLNAALYSDTRVVDALKGIPRSARIRLIYTSDKLDEGSAEFIRELVLRGVQPRRCKEKVRHTVLVDARDTKIEELGVTDDAPEKRADYYYDDPQVARRVKGEIDALKTMPGSFPQSAAAPASAR